MSHRFTKLAATGFCLLMVIVASRQAEMDTIVQSNRAPASVESRSNKMRILKPTDINGLIHTEKVHGPLRASVEAMGPSAVAVGETFAVRGVISAAESVSDVSIKWSLPKGVELINGAMQDSLRSVYPDQPVHFELTLKKLVEGNLQIHLSASAARGNFRFADVAQFNTNDQEKINERVKKLVQSNQKIIEEQRAESANKELKVFH